VITQISSKTIDNFKEMLDDLVKPIFIRDQAITLFGVIDDADIDWDNVIEWQG
jgi:hypothetical protein